MNILKQSQQFIQGMKEKIFKPKAQMPQDHSLLGMIVSGQDTFTDEGQIGKYCTLSWQVQNQAEVAWPSNVQLDLVYSYPPCAIHPQIMQGRFGPGETQEI